MPKTKVINMSLPLPLYEDLDKVAKKQEVSRSEILKRALRSYLREEERWQMIRKWGENQGKRLGIQSETDIERIIDEVRNEEKIKD